MGLHKREKRQATEASIPDDEMDAPATKLPRLRRRATWLAAHRVDYSVYYLRLRREEFATLSAIRRGLSLAEALDAGFADSRIALAQRPKQLRAWFARWAELGWICAPELESLLAE